MEANLNTIDLCTIPLVCVLLSTLVIDGVETKEMKNMTQLLLKAVDFIMGKRDIDSENFDPFNLEDIPQYTSVIEGHSHLAAQGITEENYKLVFNKGDIEKFGLDDCAINSAGLLEAFTDTMSKLTATKTFTFMQRLIQDFLVAVNACLSWKKVEVDMLSTVNPASRKYDNVQLFMVGLLGDADNGHAFLNKLVSPEESQISYETKSQQFVKQLFSQKAKNKEVRLQLIRCADEDQYKHVDQDTIKKTILTGGGKTLDLSNILGGILPHQMASIGKFIKEVRVDGITAK